MKTKSIVLPGLALGAAILLIAPGSESLATFSVTGEKLSTTQRDVRTFNNYSDPQSNNNSIMYGMFPGWINAEQATWKAIVEWGSTPHGTGGGDPTQGNLGDGGANFDGAWMGSAAGIGSTNDNIISAVNNCSGGVIAYTELPASNGWRIRMCDNSWVFADGPSGIGGGQFDIQGIVTHEYGHALGLGHSCVNAATMFASGATGSVTERSIHPDDTAGVQAVYGVASATKPAICETSCSGGVLTITGTNFDATSNTVWFTNSQVTATGVDPRILVSGVASSGGGSTITVAIPALASPGDVLVKIPGGNNGSGLSNAFPCDLVGTISSATACPFGVTSITSPIPALVPGTQETVTLKGSQLNTVTSLVLNLFQVISPSRWTIVDNETITIDMPQTGFLGANSLTINTASDSIAIAFTIEETATPQLELGTGDDFNQIPNGGSMNVIAAGKVGTQHRIYYSTSPIPSSHPVIDFAMGNNFTNLFVATNVTIPASGYFEMSVPVTYTGVSNMDFYSQSVDLTTAPAPKYGVSNLQIITLTP